MVCPIVDETLLPLFFPSLKMKKNYWKGAAEEIVFVNIKRKKKYLPVYLKNAPLSAVF